MKAALIFMIILCTALPGRSQPLDFLRSDTSSNQLKLPRVLALSFKGQRGQILTTDVPVLEESIELYPATALEFRLGISTYGRKRWQQLSKYPDFGFGFYQVRFLPYDNPLGQPRAIYFYYNQPLISISRFSLNFDFVNGMAFRFNEYDPEDNPRQVGIGSEYNGHASLGFETRIRLTDFLTMAVGINHTHFSNGKIRTPQRGINQVTGNGSLIFHFTDPVQKWYTGKPYSRSIPERITHELPDFKPILEFYLVANAGVVTPTEDYRIRDVHYSVFTGSMVLARHYSHKGKIAMGLDIFYDESMSEKYGIPLSELPQSDKVFFGLHAGHELMVNRFTLVAQMGVPLDNRDVKGRWYGRFAMRIDITRNVFIRYALKVPDNWESDFIEWGIGVSVARRKP